MIFFEIMKEVSFSRKEETLEAKAVWFQEKPIRERLLAALEWLDFVRLISPKKGFYEDAHKTCRSFRILEQRRH